MKKLENFDPKSKKYPYTDITDMHYLKFKKLKEFHIDKNYPFINKDRWFLFQDKLLRILLVTIGYLIIKIRLGIKVIGKENIKKNKNILNGAITVSNHIHMMDYMAINYGLNPIKPKVLVWDKNVFGGSKWFVRHIGGIPIPENDIQASKVFYKTIKNYLNDGGFLHIYAEGSMWELYRYIRPFKKGLSQIAYMTKKPIIPMAFSYRKPGFIRSKIFKQEALITLNIGKPIFPDYSDTSSLAKDNLTILCHKEVVKLAGIDNNIYESIFNNTKRIDY